MSTRPKFPHFDEIPTPPGCEGWEEMYPYYIRFGVGPKRKELEKQKFWFYDSLHFPGPQLPFYHHICSDIWSTALAFYNVRGFCIPAALGIEHRFLYCHFYACPNAVTDPKEIEKRVELFKKRAGYYYERWNELYAKWEEKMRNLIEEVRSLEIKELPEVEPEERIFNALGVSTGYEFIEKVHKLLDYILKAWQYHFEFLNLGYAAYLTFFDFCKKAFPGIPDQTIARMVAGIEVVLFRPDDECKRLAKLARELGIADIIKEKASKPGELFEELGRTDVGKKWLEEYEKAKYPWFCFAEGTGWYFNERRWIENPELPLSNIKTYIEKLEKGESIDRPLEKLREERERIAAEYRNLLKTEEDKRTFDQLLSLARTVFPYVENHLFYVEHWAHTIFYQKLKELGAVLAKAGFWKDPNDIFYLNRYEIDMAVMDYVIAWSQAQPPAGPEYWPPIIEKRKKIMEAARKWTPPPALGAPPEVVTEPFTIMLWGITSEKINDWLRAASIKVEEVTELKGFPASPGVAEGVARVCLTPAEIPLIQPGEILIAPVTAPSWAPAFGKVKAVVTDIGGMMSHAAIVSREYGIPCVPGTGMATRVIKTGYKIRVDGNKGVVTILEKQ